MDRIASHDVPAGLGVGTLGNQGGNADQRPGTPRRQPVGKVIKQCRRSSEGGITFVLMSDHAVQRVDRLVGDDPRQAEQRIPQHRRHHGVGEVFRRRFDRRAGDAETVERPGIAPRDSGDGVLGLVDTFGERHPDPQHALVKAIGGDQGAGQQCLGHPSSLEATQPVTDSPADGDGKCHDDYEGGHAAAEARRGGSVRIVQAFLQCADQISDQLHWVGDAVIQQLGIADQRVQRHRCQQNKKWVDEVVKFGKPERQHRAKMIKCFCAVNREMMG